MLPLDEEVVVMKRLIPILLGAMLILSASGASSDATTRLHHHHRHAWNSGSCSGSSHWSLELGRMMMMDDIWVRFEVRTSESGQRWRVKLTDDGVTFWRGTRTTHPDGDFIVHDYTDDRSGSDTIVGRAVNPKTGEVCRGSATLR